MLPQRTRSRFQFRFLASQEVHELSPLWLWGDWLVATGAEHDTHPTGVVKNKARKVQHSFLSLGCLTGGYR